jgi:glycosyltransferase involved in cell wall biosynthesis
MGHVASLETAMRDVSVAVAPMRAGAGTNVKVLSLLSLGLPMVATNLAVEGLGLIPGVHLLLEDDVAEISGMIATLLSDDELASRLSAKGHEFVWKEYHWENAGTRVRDLYESELP